MFWYRASYHARNVDRWSRYPEMLDRKGTEKGNDNMTTDEETQDFVPDTENAV